MKRIFIALTMAFLTSIGGCANEHSSTGPLRCIGPTQKAAIREAPLKNLPAVFVHCRSEFGARLSSFGLPEKDLRFVFSAIAAHSLAPYGPSEAFDFEKLLWEKHLDCDNYAALAGYFARILSPGREKDISIVGFDGGAVGNHAQMFFRLSEGRSILVDPTIGLYADENFDDLMRGKKIPLDKIAVISMHPDKSLNSFRQKVYTALSQGQYRPSDLLYYFGDLQGFLFYSRKVAPLFADLPRSLPKIVPMYPTPAVSALKKDLSVGPPH